MAQLIPIFLSTSADFNQQLELNGDIIDFRIQWNVRNDTAFLDFTDSLGATVYGIKVVPNWPLLRQLKSTLDFDGDIIVIKEDPALGDEIEYTTLGNGYNVYYVTTTEALEWETANGAG